MGQPRNESSSNTMITTFHLDHIFRKAEPTIEPSFQTARERIRESATKNDQAMQAWTASLSDEADIKHENEEKWTMLSYPKR